MKLRSRRVLVLALIGAVLSVAVRAQVSSANVTGVVEDSTGARIRDAVVKLINTQTGSENDSQTNSWGLFLAAGLIPGSYVLEIERTGFATIQVAGLTLSVGETRSLLIRMKVGSILQTVRVDASGLPLDTSDGSVSTVIDPRFVAGIPLSGRSFQDLISMIPGVVTQSPQAIGGGPRAEGNFSVNGQRPGTNTFTVDGISAQIGIRSLVDHQKIVSTGDLLPTTAIDTTQTLLSIDALQEFRALGSSYSAEYGGTPGGQFVLLSRSGTSKVHGSVFEYMDRSAFDAGDWFGRYYSDFYGDEGNSCCAGCCTFGSYHEQDFGGTFAAPLHLQRIRRPDRTFLFASFEGFRDSQPSAPLVQFSPSLLLYQEVPPALRPLIKDFAVVNGNNSLLTNAGVASESFPGSVSATTIRLDHVFSARLSGFFRFSDTPSNSESGTQNSMTTNRLRTQTFTAGTTAQLSSVLTNDLRLGYARSGASLFTLPLFSPSLDAVLGIPSSDKGAVADGFIELAGEGTAEVDADNASGSLHQWDLRDTFAVQLAHHLLQAGIEDRHVTADVIPPPLSVEADFFDASSLLNNQASDISVTRSLPAHIGTNEFAAFVQDNWRISKTLTLSPGLRWEVDPAPRGRNSADAYTLLGSLAAPAALTLAPRGTPLWKTTWFNFAPRLGVAWIADNHPGRELVVRAGGGVFFDSDNRAAAGAFSGLGFSATSHLENGPVPVTAAQLDFSPTPSAPYTNTLAFAFPPHMQLPFTWQWNLSIEKALGKNQALTTSWVGASGRRLLDSRRIDINAQNPVFGEIETFPGSPTSNYQALQMKYQRSVFPGLQALATYTWSHALDYGSTDPVWPLQYANSDFDVRHNLQMAFSWNESGIAGDRMRRYLLGGWELDGRLIARSAFPITPVGATYSDPATGNRYYSGVDLIPGRPLYLYGSQYPGGRMFNGGPNATDPALVLPVAGTAGNAPRNRLRGFGDEEVNLALRRDIRLRNQVGLRIGLETFNVFNHPDLGFIDPGVTDLLFGQATLMLNQSFGPTGSLYEPGGPRSIQAAIRLHF